MIFHEAWRDVRVAAWVRWLRSTMLAAFVAVAYCISVFLLSAQDALHTGLRPEAEREFVSLTDSLHDPSAFEEFTSSPEALARLAEFQHGLGTLTRGTFLSAFNQQVAIQGAPPSPVFAAGPGGERGDPDPYFHDGLNAMAQDVRAMQLNESAWDFFGLKLSDGGRAIDWEQIDYSGASPVPVILGAAYRDYYAVGDRVTVGFYNQVIDTEVHGFLPERSMMYYKGEVNYSLDELMVFPYPSAVRAADLAGDPGVDFYRILLFAMMAGEIALNDGETVDAIADELAVLAQQSGFSDYLLLGAPDYLTQFRLVRNLVAGNQELVLLTLGALGVVVALISLWASLHLARKRSACARILWQAGVSLEEIRVIHSLGSLAYFLVTGILFWVISTRFPGQDFRLLLLAAGVYGGYCLVELYIEFRATVAHLVSG